MSEDNKLELPANIWEKYTKTVEVDGAKKSATDFKSIILEQQYEILILKEQIKKLNEAMGYVAHFIDAEENKNKIEIVKPDLILPR